MILIVAFRRGFGKLSAGTFCVVVLQKRLFLFSHTNLKRAVVFCVIRIIRPQKWQKKVAQPTTPTKDDDEQHLPFPIRQTGIKFDYQNFIISQDEVAFHALF